MEPVGASVEQWTAEMEGGPAPVLAPVLLGALRAVAPRPWRLQAGSGWLALLLVLAAGLVLQGCAASGSGGGRRVYTHVVARGETAWLIAQRYGTTVDALARVNGLRDPSRISVGQRLRVPARGSAVQAQSGVRRSGALPAVRPRRPDGPPGAWVWPVEGPISSGFGRRWARQHSGIDIVAPSGTAVRAAAPGRVVHSGRGASGYGNMVIVRHEGELVSVYAHHRRNLVRVGQWVRQGQVIAEVGQTGRASGPHLHFELRRDGRPQNPLHFLP